MEPTEVGAQQEEVHHWSQAPRFYDVTSLSASSASCLWMKVMSQIPALATVMSFHHDELYPSMSKQILTSLS